MTQKHSIIIFFLLLPFLKSINAQPSQIIFHTSQNNLAYSPINLHLAHINAQHSQISADTPGFISDSSEIHAGSSERYLDNVFSETKRTTEIYFSKEKENLKVDIIEPVQDESKTRPLLLYVHGGGFKGGKRDANPHIRFCSAMAQKGYVAATMSYTLLIKESFGCDCPAPKKINTFLLTANDISRAVAFFTHHAKEYRIDTNRIILIGSSAGAEAILHAAYWNKSRRFQDKQILSHSFRYAGVISMAGAITSLKMITENSAIPTQLFHGTCDNLVPYASAPHHYCPVESPGYLRLHGSYAIAEKLRKLGKPYYLVTGCNDGHEWAGKPLRDNIHEISSFLFYDVINHQKRQIHLILTSGDNTCPEYNSLKFCH